MKLDALAFGAHPDDVELTCGGTLIKLVRKGYKVGMAALTQAEWGTRGSSEIRRQEFERAARIMGLQVYTLLDLPDGRISVDWPSKLKVIELIRRYQPEIIFLPYWEDRHPDHANASRLIQEAAFLSGLKRLETKEAHFRPKKLIFYMCAYEFTPSFVVDITDTFEQKLRAIQAYESQFFHPENPPQEEETYVSRALFLEALINRARYYGNRIHKSYGEPFLVRELLEVEDPVAFFSESIF